MTIRRGDPWEQPLPAGTEVVVADDDRAAAARVQASVGGVEEPPTIHIRDGDVHRSLGGTAVADGAIRRVRCAMDAVRMRRIDGADGVEYVAVAHVVIRRPWWAGRFVVVMNTTHLGTWNLGPRAHPGDGLLDVTEGRLGFADRLQARRRAPSGAHLPHPGLVTRRVPRDEIEVPRGARIIVDGRTVGRGPSTWSVEVVPDAWWWAPNLP